MIQLKGIAYSGYLRYIYEIICWDNLGVLPEYIFGYCISRTGSDWTFLFVVEVWLELTLGFWPVGPDFELRRSDTICNNHIFLNIIKFHKKFIYVNWTITS